MEGEPVTLARIIPIQCEARAWEMPAPVKRDVVLITHANPEDNAFSRWLGARLAAAGYKVWVDLRSLRGGDDFWDLIDQTLRTVTIKQVVVVSPHLNKPGVKKELAIGDAVGRKLNDPSFMIPVRVADVDFSTLPPELIRHNTLNAHPNWAACLQPLLETLEEPPHGSDHGASRPWDRSSSSRL